MKRLLTVLIPEGKRIVFSWRPHVTGFRRLQRLLKGRISIFMGGTCPSVAKLANIIGNGKTLAEAIASHHTTIEDVGKIARGPT